MSRLITRMVNFVASIWLTPTPLSAGMCRIALALLYAGTLYFLPGNMGTWLSDRARSATYDPVGILRFLGTEPPIELLSGLQWLTRLAIPFLLVGMFTRLALLLCTVCMLFLCSSFYSFEASPSHTFIPGLFAGFGLLAGVRSPLSIDYLLTRTAQKQSYWLTPRIGVLLAIFSVTYPLFNAAMYKIYWGNGHAFAWGYSDNLRNTLLYQHWKFQDSPPEMIAWVAAQPWLYKSTAFLNLFSQGAPVFACFMVRWPWLRLLFATTILAEVIGLGLMMKMWNGYGTLWLVLILIIIDWDAIGRWHGIQAAPPVPARSYWANILAGCLFMGLIVGFTCHKKYHREWYPLQPFSMFSSVMATRPFSQHQPFQLLMNDYQIETEPALTAEQHREVFLHYHEDPGTPGEVSGRVRTYCQNVFGVRVLSIHATKGYHIIPAAPDTQIRRAIAVTWFDWLESSKKLESLRIDEFSGWPPYQREIRRFKVRVEAIGFEPDRLTFWQYRRFETEPVAIKATRLSEWEYGLEMPPEPGNSIIVIRSSRFDQAEPTDYFGYFIQAAP